MSACDPSLTLEFDRQTHSDLCGSDHFAVILKTSSTDDEPSEYWKFDKADWPSFRTLFISMLSDGLVLSEDPVAQFTDILIEIANKTRSQIPSLQNKLPKVPWFNDACKQAIKEHKKSTTRTFPQS